MHTLANAISNRPDAPVESRIRASAREYTIAIHGSALVLVWHQNACLAGVRAARRLSASPEIQMALVYIAKPSRIPDNVTMRDIKLWAREFSPRPAALVYENEGFAAAALRSILVGIQAFTAKPRGSDLFSSVPAAIRWLKKCSPRATGLDSLPQCIELARKSGPRRSELPPDSK